MVNPYLEGNFAPVLEERTDDHALEVTGVVPPDLEGALLRNGPNPLSVPDDPADYHWFSGDGMLHAHLAGRRPGHRATATGGCGPGRWPPRWRPPAPAGRASRSTDRPTPTSSGTPAPRWPWSSPGFPHAVSPDLDRARIHDFDGALSSPMTAHPKVDPVTGELVFFGVDLFGPPFLRYHVADAAGQLTTTEDDRHPAGDDDARLRGHRHPGRLPRPARRLRPGAGRPGAAAAVPVGARGRRPGRGAAPRRARATTSGGSSMDPSYVFHVLNAFDDGDRTVLDVVRYDARVRHRPRRGHHPRRSRPPPVDGRPGGQPGARGARSTTRPVEFPRIDPAVAGPPHRYGYCVRTGRPIPHRPELRGTGQVRPRPRRGPSGSTPGPGRIAGRAGLRAGRRRRRRGRGLGAVRRSTTPPGTPATWSSSTPRRSPAPRWPPCTCRPGCRSDSTARGCPSDS